LPLQLIYKGKTNRCHPRHDFPADWHITHSPKHWSTEETMIQYVENIIMPYIERTRETLGNDSAALVIMDNFKGQVTDKMTRLLESYNIHTCLIPPNTTDRLQPMDVAVNKPAKAFIRQCFQAWYGEQISMQLDGEHAVEEQDVDTVDLGMTVMKEAGAKWLEEMFEYISDNPQFIVNGFIRAGITGALDGKSTDNEPLPDTQESCSEDSDTADDDSDKEDNSVIDYIVL